MDSSNNLSDGNVNFLWRQLLPRALLRGCLINLLDLTCYRNCVQHNSLPQACHLYIRILAFAFCKVFLIFMSLHISRKASQSSLAVKFKFLEVQIKKGLRAVYWKAKEWIRRGRINWRKIKQSGVDDVPFAPSFDFGWAGSASYDQLGQDFGRPVTTVQRWAVQQFWFGWGG